MFNHFLYIGSTYFAIGILLYAYILVHRAFYVRRIKKERPRSSSKMKYLPEGYILDGIILTIAWFIIAINSMMTEIKDIIED